MQTFSLSPPLLLKWGNSGYHLLSLLEEGEGWKINALNDEDGVVVAEENKDIQVLFLDGGTVKLRVQCESVTYAHSSTEMGLSSFCYIKVKSAVQLAFSVLFTDLTESFSKLTHI